MKEIVGEEEREGGRDKSGEGPDLAQTRTEINGVPALNEVERARSKEVID